MNQSCKNCGKDFQIFPEDSEFYKKVEVPVPTHCPSCRAQRRFAYRNERSLYKRKCDKCGGGMVAMFPEDFAGKVYCEHCWWGDQFDPLEFGRDFDFQKPFFEQMDELLKTAPLPYLIIGSGENADFTNYSWKNKDSYLLSSSDYCENCYYSDYLFRARDCIDCLMVSDSELVYEAIDAKNCYACAFIQNSQDLSDCYFCFDCRGCQNCLGCVGLRQKKYHIFNQEFSKEEYEKKKAEFFAQNKNMDTLRKQFVEFKLKFPHKYAEIENSENCSGDHLQSCKNCDHSFDLVECEDMRYSAQGLKGKDCVDCTGMTASELCYESGACPEDYALKFCMGVWPKSSFLEYCFMSRMSNYCFGCVSLHKNEYCILNKQYTKSEYGKMVAKIKEQMKETGEYGEFFPISISPFAYNQTVANSYYPLSQEETLGKGYKWHEDKVLQAPKDAFQLSENTEDVPKDICEKVLVCEVSGRPYKIIPSELKFYQKMKLPLPRRCPDQRYKDRMSLRNPRELFERKCDKCGKEIETSYGKESKEMQNTKMQPSAALRVFCEKCYLEAIY